LLAVEERVALNILLAVEERVDTKYLLLNLCLPQVIQ
jgi:hypothetical protein